ncbi:MAG: hypothetical protein J1F28_09075 [Oscillospiraceae bacterium]|nr:hypothetical protein [Oscillospiraceae bacterium]
MTKRISAIFLAFIALLILSGCAPKLTAEEYKDELTSAYNEFMTAHMKISEIMYAVEQGDRTSLENSEFHDACEDMESSMERFERMNPPDNYKDKHKRMVKSLDNYRDWIKAVEKFVECTTPEEFEKALDEANGTLDIENGFLRQYLDLFIELTKETTI